MESYSRNDYIYLATLYEKAERFSEMFNWVNEFVKIDSNLSKEERNLLSTAYKNIISSKRTSWRNLCGLEREELKKSDQQITHAIFNIRKVRSKIEDEIKEICDKIQIMLENYLIPNAKESEILVFFLKLQGDYHRYRAEVTVDSEYEASCVKAEKAYEQGYKLALEKLPISSSIRLGLALNYSVYYYEVKLIKETACKIATDSCEEALKILDDLDKSKFKDTILIVQLLKENLRLWNSDNIEEEEDNN